MKISNIHNNKPLKISSKLFVLWKASNNASKFLMLLNPMLSLMQTVPIFLLPGTYLFQLFLYYFWYHHHFRVLCKNYTIGKVFTNSQWRISLQESDMKNGERNVSDKKYLKNHFLQSFSSRCKSPETKGDINYANLGPISQTISEEKQKKSEVANWDSLNISMDFYFLIYVPIFLKK